MATISSSVEYDVHKRTALVKWGEMSAGDDGEPFDALGWRLVSVQWSGTGSASFQGSNDLSPVLWSGIAGLDPNPGSGIFAFFGVGASNLYASKFRPRVTGGPYLCNAIFAAVGP